MHINTKIIQNSEAVDLADAIAALDKDEQAHLLPGQVLADFDPELSEDALVSKLNQRRGRLLKQAMLANAAHNLGLQVRKKKR